jgi:hypothetical protein
MFSKNLQLLTVTLVLIAGASTYAVGSGGRAIDVKETDSDLLGRRKFRLVPTLVAKAVTVSGKRIGDQVVAVIESEAFGEFKDKLDIPAETRQLEVYSGREAKEETLSELEQRANSQIAIDIQVVILKDSVELLEIQYSNRTECVVSVGYTYAILASSGRYFPMISKPGKFTIELNKIFTGSCDRAHQVYESL